MMGAQNMGMGYAMWFWLAVYAAVILIPFWKLWSRTGHSGWISLFMLIPFVNLIMIYILAFKHWPALPETDGETE